MVGGKLLQGRQDLESLLLLATKEQVTRRLGHEHDEDQSWRDEQGREGDREAPRYRVGLDPRECECEPIRESDAEGDASTEADKKKRSTTLLETFGLPCGNGGSDETVTVSISWRGHLGWISLPVANTSDDTSCDVLPKRERGALNDLSNDLNAQPGHDASASTKYVTQEKGQYGTNQASKIPATNDSSSKGYSVQTSIIHCCDAWELVAEVAQEHDATDVTYK